MLRLVGGTDVGDPDAPPVWADRARGLDRVLRTALSEDYRSVVVVLLDDLGSCTVHSNCLTTEEALGLLARGDHTLMEHAEAWAEAAVEQLMED